MRIIVAFLWVGLVASASCAKDQTSATTDKSPVVVTPPAKPPAAPVVATPAELEPPPATSTRGKGGGTPSASAAAGFEAVVRINAKPSGKKFQGVWLERDGGDRWLIAYRPTRLWRNFEGVRVRVTGSTYQPRGQAIMATHFRVDTMSVLDPKVTMRTGNYISAGKEQVMTGTFEKRHWPKGAKLADRSVLVFKDSQGGQYWLARRPDPAPTAGQRVTVRGRQVELSPFTSHPGGRWLFVLSVRAAP